ncbi:zinc ribbon domain-containing protein [Methanothrix sp.]|uniref:zinc ribbon domain-containing protein n=1 Tax=Methanothrix sp. TaxID=90426 RepID=UPI00338EF3BE
MVDSRYTSQRCSGCGIIVPKTLKDRVHECPKCGLRLGRDHNAEWLLKVATASTLVEAYRMTGSVKQEATAFRPERRSLQ